ncbi:MAG TPA: hypothetical protein P5084_12840 [Paludibacter sp.]|nr:hypothetical protein [Paludibacter sp.]
MKKPIILFLFIFLFFNQFSNAQLLEKLLNIQIRTGFAILNNGDTLLGCFEFNDSEDNYRMLVYKDPVTHKNSAYLPQDVNLFSIDNLYFRPIELKDEWVFMRVLFEDKMKMYLHKKFYTTDAYSGFYNQFLIQKPSGEKLLVTIDNFYPFKTKVGNFFKDCPAIYSKIKNNIYQANDLFKITMEYNEWLKGK